MTKMKDSGVEWIGLIPEDWTLPKVKNLFNIGRGRVIAQTELDDDVKYPVYSSQTQNDGCLGYINSYDFDVDQLTWTTDGANAGTVFLRTGKHNCTNVCGTLQLKDKENNLKYLKYALEFIAIYHKRADTNGFKIMNNEMAEIIISMPSQKTQQKIADFLDKKCGEIDRLIEIQEQEIEKLKEYKTSVITKAVTKGLDDSVPMKDSGIDWIGQIPEHWKMGRLKDILLINRGLFNHRPRNDERYYGGKYPFIQTGDVAQSIKYITKYSQTLSELGIGVSKLFKKGTMVMTIAANIGDVAVLDFDAYFPDSILGLSPKFNDDNLYIYYILQSLKKEFVNNAIVSTQLNLNVERVGEIKIPYNSNIVEQTQISKYLEKRCDEIDFLVKKKRIKIEKLQEYKKSLIYEYVTGKKEVV